MSRRTGPDQGVRSPDSQATFVPAGPYLRLAELRKLERAVAIPTLKESFEGYYRWHAKRTLKEVQHVRAARAEGRVVGVSMFERLLPEVGYVNYIAVARANRRGGVGARLLDDALRRLALDRVQVVFAAAERTNHGSLALLGSRGFRRTRRKELGWKEGGLGAWGLRSRMHIVAGEVILGLRLSPTPRTRPRAASSKDARRSPRRA